MKTLIDFLDPGGRRETQYRMIFQKLVRTFNRRDSTADLSTDVVVVLSDWPQPATVPEPAILADDHSLVLRYQTTSNQIAVIRIPACTYFTFGAPNDEALGGHPLGVRGLKFYAVHEVLNSSLIQLLERRNSVHHRHNREWYLENKKHYVFTFHDSTLECVFTEGEHWKPVISIFETEGEADRFWRNGLDH